MAALNSPTLHRLDSNTWVERARFGMPNLQNEQIKQIYELAIAELPGYSKLAQNKQMSVVLPIKATGRSMLVQPNGFFFIIATHPNEDRCLGTGSYKEVWPAIDQDGHYSAFAIPHLNDVDFFSQALKVETQNLIFVKEQESFIKIKDSATLYLTDAKKKLHIIPSILLEYCNFGDLTRFLKAPSSPLSVWLEKLTLSTLNGLAFLHEKGYVHRDIKAENILVSLEKGEIVFKIGDLGSMCLITDEERLKTHTTTEHAADPQYAATIQFDNKNVFDELLDLTGTGPQLDIWGIGCILTEALGQKLPWCDLKQGLSPLQESSEERDFRIRISVISHLRNLNRGGISFKFPDSEHSPSWLIFNLLEPNRMLRPSARDALHITKQIDWTAPCFQFGFLNWESS